MPNQDDFLFVCLFPIPCKEWFAFTEVFIHQRLQHSRHIASDFQLALIQFFNLYQSKSLTEKEKKERKTILSLEIEHNFGVRQDVALQFYFLLNFFPYDHVRPLPLWGQVPALVEPREFILYGFKTLNQCGFTRGYRNRLLHWFWFTWNFNRSAWNAGFKANLSGAFQIWFGRDPDT